MQYELVTTAILSVRVVGKIASHIQACSTIKVFATWARIPVEMLDLKLIGCFFCTDICVNIRCALCVVIRAIV